MIDSKRPKVSVIMITYMHEAYISDAINGVLMQKCDFDVELIISDDCSPDRTSVIVEGFEDHPNYEWIRYVRHDSNKGMMGNFIWALEQASGEYIAMCEGDDYWTNPLKLQMQVDFLEANDLDCCNTLWQELENNQIINKGHIQKGLMVGNSYQFKAGEFSYYHTATRVIRKDVLDQIMISYPPHFIADGPLQVVLSQTKKVGVLLDYTSVYRITGSGVWTSLSLRERNLQSFKVCRDFQKYFPKSARKFATEKWNYWLTTNFPKSLNHSQRLQISKYIVKLEFFLRKIQ
jgi:glycosyltransferase involved in cell wall biosynthesis